MVAEAGYGASKNHADLESRVRLIHLVLGMELRGRG